MTGEAPGLSAVRVPLGPGATIDPFGLAGVDGIVFCSGPTTRVGLGVAIELALPRGLDDSDDLTDLVSSLATITVTDGMASGSAHPGGDAVIAFGALPFDRSSPASLVVPHVLFGSDGDDRQWVTWITSGGTPPPWGSGDPRAWLVERSSRVDAGIARTARSGPPPPPPPPPLRIEPRTSDEGFRAMVGEALEAIEHGNVAKVVLARQVEVTMGRPIIVADLLRRWHGLEPNCAVFSVPTAEGQFIGATPELLVERSGRSVRSRPLAGTTGRRGGDPGGRQAGALLASSKDGTEHRLVVEAIEEVLAPRCDVLDVPAGPGLVHLQTMTHLGTSITGTLATPGGGSVPSALDLVAALHPTPAVGGVPTPAARRLIDHLEPGSRGHYAGPVGYVDAGGDGTWMVGIRSLTARGATASLAAGVGIVDGSDPESELAETNLKLTAVFGALSPGVPFSTDGFPVAQAAERHEAVS